MSAKPPTPPDPNAAASGTGPVRQVAQTSVQGERDLPSVNRGRSLRSRVHGALGIAVLALVGSGFLVWWYTRTNDAVERQTRSRQEREARTAAEMKLPPLGEIETPRAAATDLKAPPDEGPTLIGDVLGPAPPMTTPAGLASPPPFAAAPPAGPTPPSPAELALQRKLAPGVLVRASGGVPPAGGASADAVLPAQVTAGAPGMASTAGPAVANTTGPRGTNTIGSYLTPTVTPATAAQVLASRRFVVPKGNFLDCTLETALDSQLPGLVTCVTAVDIFGADGHVVLIERGSKLVGESRGEVRQGMNRVFVLWTEARTPTGVVVQLASPGTDALGRAGLPGYADTHFWSRFGAAILISVIDGAFRIGAQAATRSDTSVVLTPGASRDVMTEVLRNTIAIPPTVVKNQGERIQVLVARDVDFRPVYELRATVVEAAPATPVASEGN
ncbi:MAG: type IV secretion system protein VirB10 [Burkholderiales bacterium]|nr:type IV secretion system protein VirB10 [Burkholderiales bacterium]